MVNFFSTMLTTDAPRLQPLLVRAVVEALFSIFCENRHADKVIEFVLRNNRKAGSRDRAFIAENTYEIVRYYRLYAKRFWVKYRSHTLTFGRFAASILS